MKRFLAFTVLLTLCASAWAAAPVTVISAKPTFAWDATTKDSAGNVVPATVTITYDLFSRPKGGGASITLLTGITATTAVPGLPPWYTLDIGLRVVFTAQDGTVLIGPTIWGSTDGVPPFLVFTGVLPGGAGNFRALP